MQGVPDRAQPHTLTHAPELPAPDLSAFRVLADDRVVDLRGWRPGRPDDPDLDCSVIYQIRRDMAM